MLCVRYVICSIDATHSGGLGRMCNDDHKRPNAIMKKIVADKVYLCLFALRDIRSGAEIRFDYGADDGNMPWRKQPELQRGESRPVSQSSVLAADTVPVDDLPTAVELPRAEALHSIPPSSDHGLEAEPVNDSRSTVEPHIICITFRLIWYIWLTSSICHVNFFQ